MSTGVDSQFRSFSSFENLEYGKHLVEVFPGSGPFTLGPCRALIVGSVGDLNLFDSTSQAAAGVPFEQGWHPLSVQELSSGGTAGSIWAVY